MMPVIKTMVNEEIYAELVRRRKHLGLPSVSALFLKSCDLLSEDQEATEIVRSAFKNLRKKTSGYEFRLRDLFPSDRWNSFSKGARLRAGRMFQEQVAEATHGVRATHKSASNHQFYLVADKARPR
jgi:hypothetical protein